MHYTIRHVTTFSYESPISESVMEARMQPLSDSRQRCIRFGLSTTPSSRVRMYQDPDGNMVHHFGIPGRHSRLTVTAEAFVECAPPPELPQTLGADAWERLDAATAAGEFLDALKPSPFATRTARLCELAEEMTLRRLADPVSTLWQVMGDLYTRFEYKPKSTRVDSPIDDALSTRQGVCQDFAHIMIALVREVGIPCRYVSGYLFQPVEQASRSADGATHAWVEAWLLDLGWVGFDPTHNSLAGEHHIRVAIGRDYADVPPTRGVFKGLSSVRNDLAVAVSVGTASEAAAPAMFTPWMSREASPPLAESDPQHQQQQ
jgi:transglutaminase-like putative cysteine protease